MGGGIQTAPALREDNGHARVPASYIIDGFKLGEWVTRQRQFHAKGRLEADRERRLQVGARLDMGTLSPTNGKKGSDRLLRYRRSHGHARVPRSYIIDGFRLGQWVGTQRQFRAKGTP